MKKELCLCRVFQRTLCSDINSSGICDMCLARDMLISAICCYRNEIRNLYHIAIFLKNYIEFVADKYIEFAKQTYSKTSQPLNISVIERFFVLCFVLKNIHPYARTFLTLSSFDNISLL